MPRRAEDQFSLESSVTPHVGYEAMANTSHYLNRHSWFRSEGYQPSEASESGNLRHNAIQVASKIFLRKVQGLAWDLLESA